MFEWAKIWHRWTGQKCPNGTALKLNLPSGENELSKLWSRTPEVVFAMKEDKDLLKTAIWVTSGLVAGAALMWAIQYWTPNQEIVKQAADSDKDIVESAVARSQTLVPDHTALSAQAAANAEHKLVPVPSPYPVSSALAVLNGNANQTIVETTQQTGVTYVNLAPGTSLSESTSGYPITMGRRAVDSAFVVAPDSSSSITEVPPQPVGRNGLLSNPCVDPPSTHGAAYGRRY